MEKNFKKIAINQENAQKINDALEKFEHRCSTRLMKNYDNLMKYIDAFIETLPEGLPKKALAKCKLYVLVGACRSADKASSFWDKSYGQANGTEATIVFDSKGNPTLSYLDRIGIRDAYTFILNRSENFNNYLLKFYDYQRVDID